MKLIDSIKVNNQLGESVIWDPQEQCVWWIDIFGKNIYRLQWPSKNLDVFSTTERPCAIGLTDKENILIVAFETGVSLYNPKTKEIIEWIYRPFKLNSGIRFNDGKVDRQGRFWISTMIESTDKIDITESGLYCIETSGKITKHFSSFTIGNSIAWSPCSTKMYFSDSQIQTIWQFDFDEKQATITNQQEFSILKENVAPDGADVDHNGNFWCTNWGDNSITKYSLQENNNINYSLPVSQPTCLAFGGEKLDLLFLTSAQYQLSSTELNKQPHAGSLLIFQTSSKGIKQTLFGEANASTL